MSADIAKEQLDISKSCPMYLVKQNTIKTCKAAAKPLLYTFVTWTQTEVNCRLEAPASLLPVGSGQELGRPQSRSEYSSAGHEFSSSLRDVS
jgi:hypothetical protein